MGMMRLPLLDENDFTSIDYEQVNQMVDAFMDAGFNYFDTAFIYHETVGEQAFKKCVADRYPRDSFKIATKLPLSLSGRIRYVGMLRTYQNLFPNAYRNRLQYQTSWYHYPGRIY